MASTQVQPREDAPHRPVNRGGRPKKPPAPLAAVAAAIRELDDEDGVDETGPAPAEETGQPRVFRGSNGEDFFEWLSGFSSDEWQFMMGYLYRTAPTIDRRAAGKPVNIRRYSTFFDQDMIMHDEGSGGYRIDLTRRDPASGKSQRIGQVYINIMNLDYPPRVPAGDWIDQPENDVWKWAKPAIERAQVTGQFTHHEQQVDPNKVFDTVLAGVERLSQRGNNGDNIAAATINQLGGMVTALMNRPVPVADNSATTQIITFLQTELAETRKEIRSMRESQKNEKPSGILDQLKELVPVVKEVTGIFNLKAAAKPAGTSWAEVVSDIVKELGEQAPILYQMWQRPNGAPGSTGGFRLPAAKTAEQPAAAAAQPAAAATPAEAKQQEDGLTEEKKTRYKAILDKWRGLIESSAPFMVDNFRRGKTGFEFRDWFIETQGAYNYSQFQLEVSPDELTDLAQLHQMMAPLLQPKDKLYIFLKEFLTKPGEEGPDVTVTNLVEE